MGCSAWAGTGLPAGGVAAADRRQSGQRCVRLLSRRRHLGPSWARCVSPRPGLLKPGQVLVGMWVVFGLAALLGVYLFLEAGWPVLLIGLASILAAIAYTGGPLPFGYYGLGDLVVFIFFGPVAVCGTYFVQAGRCAPLAVWSSLPMGFLIIAILVVNNLRDIATDRAVAKVPWRCAWAKRARAGVYLCAWLAAYLVPLHVGPVWRFLLAWVLLAWLSLPLAISQTHAGVDAGGSPAQPGAGRHRPPDADLWSAFFAWFGIVRWLTLM